MGPLLDELPGAARTHRPLDLAVRCKQPAELRLVEPDDLGVGDRDRGRVAPARDLVEQRLFTEIFAGLQAREHDHTPARVMGADTDSATRNDVERMADVAFLDDKVARSEADAFGPPGDLAQLCRIDIAEQPGVQEDFVIGRVVRKMLPTRRTPAGVRRYLLLPVLEQLTSGVEPIATCEHVGDAMVHLLEPQRWDERDHQRVEVTVRQYRAAFDHLQVGVAAVRVEMVVRVPADGPQREIRRPVIAAPDVHVAVGLGTSVGPDAAHKSIVLVVCTEEEHKDRQDTLKHEEQQCPSAEDDADERREHDRG